MVNDQAFLQNDRDEKLRSRKLWEEVFPEDTVRFLDYYYSEKIRDNEILAISDAGEDVAMLHLNPYRLRIGRGAAPCNYIVAVATRKEYRRRGYMAGLLGAALRRMYARREPFTFLMPANEAIYRPFGFSFVYDQEQRTVTGARSELFSFCRAQEEDAARLAHLAQEVLDERIAGERGNGCFALRDAAYYRRLLLEMESENGGIVLAYTRGVLAGSFLYGNEDGFEILEPLLLPEAPESSGCGAADPAPERARAASGGAEDFAPGSPKTAPCGAAERYGTFLSACAYHLAKDTSTPVKCRGLLGKGDRRVPMIMARIVHLPALLECLKPTCGFLAEFAVEDPILPGNDGIFRVEAKDGTVRARRIGARTKAERAYTPEELVRVLFGYARETAGGGEPLSGGAPMGIRAPQNAKRTDRGRLLPLSGVFLNEIV